MNTPTNEIAGLPIQPLVDQATWVKTLIYGFPGVGKTHLAGTASLVEDMCPILWVDTEKGTRTIRGCANIDVVEIENTYDPATGRLQRHAWQKIADLAETLRTGRGPKQYRTLVVDNITECQRIAMDWTMAEMLTTHPSRDPLVPDKREWGKSSEMILRMGQQLRDLDMHVIMTAHAKEITNEAGAVVRTTPGLPGQLAEKMPALVDLVGYLYIKEIGGENKRFLQTGAMQAFTAKDRSGALSERVEAPTMTTIHAALA